MQASLAQLCPWIYGWSRHSYLRINLRKCQLPLIPNPINGSEMKGLSIPKKTNLQVGVRHQLCHFRPSLKLWQQSVVICLSINLKIMGESAPSLLDSCYIISLMRHVYFNIHFRLWLEPAEGSVADTHHRFNLKMASGGSIQLSRYMELDMEILRLQVIRVRFLIT